jgi:hypothetical protein
MRTVKETFAKRLELQKKEADVQGMAKVASNLEHVVEKLEIRGDTDSYLYLEKDATSDVEKHIWDAVVRLADFYDCHVDAGQMQEVIEKLANDLMHEVRVQGGVRHGIGAHEPEVHGETPERVTIEVD